MAFGHWLLHLTTCRSLFQLRQACIEAVVCRATRVLGKCASGNQTTKSVLVLLARGRSSYGSANIIVASAAKFVATTAHPIKTI